MPEPGTNMAPGRQEVPSLTRPAPGMRWLVLAGAAWWLIGDRYSSLYPGAESLIRALPRQPRCGTTSTCAGGRCWARCCRRGILAGFIWRVFTTRVGGPVGVRCVILSACPVLAALLEWAVTRSLTLL